MMEQVFDTQKLTSEIENCLCDVAKELTDEGRMSNKDWTQECLGKLAELGEKNGYHAATCSRCGDHEWLYDLIWWKGEDGGMTDLILALESEWSPSFRDVRYDFQKLVQARARIKVLISDAMSIEDRQILISDIDNFALDDNDGVYLFVMYNGNPAKPRRFGFFRRNTLCGLFPNNKGNEIHA